MYKKISPQGIKNAGLQIVKPGFKAVFFLLMVMIPASLAVQILETGGVLYYIAHLMNPLMNQFDLPGEAALVVISAVFLNVYSAIGVIHTLDLSIREITILGTICLIAHNFFVECTVMKRIGSSLIKIVLLRIFCAFAAGFVLHLLLPDSFGEPKETPPIPAVQSEPEPIGFDLQQLVHDLIRWGIDTGLLSLRITAIVFGILFVQKLLDEMGIIKKLGSLTSPLMTILGLSPNMGYFWLIVNMVGVSYGSAILSEEIRLGSASKSEIDLLNHHAAISHAQIEDTLLFVSLGVPYLWIALPRFIMAVIVVWLERGRQALFRRSFRVNVESG
ncbi:MAG: transporter [Treponema sp.]|jgi:spore maturation protein SpmB|nr:transporter [Treponema sp.]